MAGNKHVPERKSEPSRKHTAIDLGMKRRMIHKYEGGQILCAISPELGFAVSTVITIVKDATEFKGDISKGKKLV
jgi:hypothetical protein